MEVAEYDEVDADLSEDEEEEVLFAAREGVVEEDEEDEDDTFLALDDVGLAPVGVGDADVAALDPLFAFFEGGVTSSVTMSSPSLSPSSCNIVNMFRTPLGGCFHITGKVQPCRSKETVLEA